MRKGCFCGGLCTILCGLCGGRNNGIFRGRESSNDNVCSFVRFSASLLGSVSRLFRNYSLVLILLDCVPSGS